MLRFWFKFFWLLNNVLKIAEADMKNQNKHLSKDMKTTKMTLPLL